MLSSQMQSILNNRLRYLSPLIAKAVSSVDWPTKVIEAARRYGLHMEDIEDLQMVVLKSMTGLLDPADFEKNVIAATALSPATVEKMILELNTTIFEPIHNFIIEGGKAENPLEHEGIHVTTDDSDPASPFDKSQGSAKQVERTTQSFTGQEGGLEIPASPEPVPRKPFVEGSFEPFFINHPTTTDHSMVK